MEEGKYPELTSENIQNARISFLSLNAKINKADGITIDRTSYAYRVQLKTIENGKVREVMKASPEGMDEIIFRKITEAEFASVTNKAEMHKTVMSNTPVKEEVH